MTSEHTSPRSADERITLLLVEDDLPTQDFMKMALGKNFTIHTAVSADEVRTTLASHGIEIILMDLSIKGEEDGIQLTRALRASEQWQHIPIIALTAHAYDRDRENALTAGCNAYFSKPFNRKDLLQKIQELVRPATA
jgi:CheY-like chemotaxis protein